MKQYLYAKVWIMGLMFVFLGFVNNTYSQTADLTTHQPSGTLPNGTTFEWHDAIPIAASNLVVTPTTVSAGLYYGVYNFGTCYSAATPIRVLTNTCPITTVNLKTAVDTTVIPSGMKVTYHSNIPVSSATLLSGTSITEASQGTYYIAYYDLTGECYSEAVPIIVIATSCLAPDLITTIGQPTPSPVADQVSSIPVTVSNIGTAPTTGPITEIVQIPTGTTFGTFPTNNNGWTCTTSGTTATCTNPGPIAAGDSSKLSVPFIPTASQVGSPLTIPAATVSGGGEPTANTTNNSSLPITTPNVLLGSILLSAKVFLQGAGTIASSPFTANADGLMRTDITAILPAVEPYTNLGNAPTEANVGTPIFTGTGTNAIVDWILVELRSSSSSSTVIARKAGLLQKDGDIVDIDGVSPMSFSLSAGSYYIAIRHRNHLGVMTANTVALSSTTSTIDFTLSTAVTYGTNAQVEISGKNYLWAGNANSNKNVIAQGANSDRSTVTSGVSGYVNNASGVNTYILNGYLATDVNMDGRTIAKGANADNTTILNIVLGYSTNTTGTNGFIIQEQLP